MKGNERGKRGRRKPEGGTIMLTIYRYCAALKPSRKVPAYVTNSRAIVAKMGAVPKLQTPLLAQTTTDLNALDLAEQATHKGGTDATADRNAKLVTVRSDMRQLKAFVQGVADSGSLNAQAMIDSAGMSVGKRAVRVKPQLAAKAGKVPTTAVLIAKAVKGRSPTNGR
jgi:hypothetical protein